MSLTDIESELEKLSPEELRRLALKSWSAFMEKEGQTWASFCEEDNPQLLSALDEAVAGADATRGQGLSGAEVRKRIAEWTTR